MGDWETRADRLMWLQSIDRRARPTSGVWVGRARALLAERPSAPPTFATRELEALAGKRNRDVAECAVCMEEACEVAVSVGNCAHAVCGDCAPRLDRCPVCRRAHHCARVFRLSMLREREAEKGM